MSVILINPFEVPKGKEKAALAFWEKVAEYMRKQPGFIATRPHQAVVPWARFHFINVAEWESVAHFETVMNNEGFRRWWDRTGRNSPISPVCMKSFESNHRLAPQTVSAARPVRARVRLLNGLE